MHFIDVLIFHGSSLSQIFLIHDNMVCSVPQIQQVCMVVGTSGIQ